MSTPAARARALAAQAVDRVRSGHNLDRVLEETFATLPSGLSGEQALIQEMVYGVIRWHFQLVPLIRDLLDKPLPATATALDALLGVGLYQLLYMRAAPHAVVNETVNAAVVLGQGRARGLVNAVLRRALRERESLQARIAADDRLALASPDWLLERLRASYPEDWHAIAMAGNARAPLTLRVNTGRLARDACADKLAAAGVTTHDIAGCAQALVLESPHPLEQLPGFAEGEWSVQDGAAQLAAPLLELRPGLRVLDACAAPGGKAAHILELEPTTRLVALDHDRRRLARVRENFARLGLSGEILAGDAAKPKDWWDGQPFDRILLDAPCSATGVIRRHPDIRLHRKPGDLARLADTQSRLLDSLWPLLAAGGKLLYVTCSILPEENRQVVNAFLSRQQDARRHALSHPALSAHARPEGPGFQILPGRNGLDGFFYAGLEKPHAAP